jgi:hypothetical protein
MNFYILCSVSGGVTGHRQALLKENGRIKSFSTREEAAEEATRLMKNVSPYATASFSYRVIDEDSAMGF